MSISDVVLYELLYGAERSNAPARIRREVEHFVARLTVLPFDSEAMDRTHGLPFVPSEAITR